MIDLGAATSIDMVAITSPTAGWAVSVYVGDGTRPELAGWGAPVASAADIARRRTTLDLDGADGGSMLLWITDLGDGPSSGSRSPTCSSSS